MLIQLAQGWILIRSNIDGIVFVSIQNIMEPYYAVNKNPYTNRHGSSALYNECNTNLRAPVPLRAWTPKHLFSVTAGELEPSNISVAALANDSNLE